MDMDHIRHTLPESAETACRQGVDHEKQKHYAEALACYREAAEQGHIEAAFRAGVLYEVGEGIPRNVPEALAWFLKAAEQGHARAQYFVGYLYGRGRYGVASDPASAAKWFRRAAEQGITRAQCYLGLLYANGSGVEQSDAQAAHWFCRALGADEATILHDPTTEDGYILEQAAPAPEALIALRAAAKAGDASAQFRLGLLYRRGLGVPQSDDEAVRWYRAAADQGYARAQDELGGMYEAGVGVPTDPELAYQWCRKAALQGYAVAQFNMGVLCEHRWDCREAAMWYLLAAISGDAPAQCTIGCLYAKPPMVTAIERNDALAAKWLLRAAEQGNTDALYNLGCLEEDDEDGTNDSPYAHLPRRDWFLLAAEAGHVEAMKALVNRCTLSGDPEAAQMWRQRAREAGYAFY